MNKDIINELLSIMVDIAEALEDDHKRYDVLNRLDNLRYDINEMKGDQ